VDRSIRIIELQDIEKRIEVLERAGINRDDKRIFSRLDALQKVVTET
jgi:hypothetical protein